MFIQQSIYRVKVTLLFLEQKKTSQNFPWMNFSWLTSFTSFNIFHGWLYRSGTDWSFIFYRAQTCQYVYVFEVEMIFLNSMFLDFARFFTFMLHKLDRLTSEFWIVLEIRNYGAIFLYVGIHVRFLKLWYVPDCFSIISKVQRWSGHICCYTATNLNSKFVLKYWYIFNVFYVW